MSSQTSAQNWGFEKSNFKMHPAIHKQTRQSNSQTQTKEKKRLEKVNLCNLGLNAFCIKEDNSSTLIQIEDHIVNYPL